MGFPHVPLHTTIVKSNSSCVERQLVQVTSSGLEQSKICPRASVRATCQVEIHKWLFD